MAKKRKPRGMKRSGRKAQNMCGGCIAFNCDPFLMSPAFSRKISKRFALKVCPSCGHNPCECRTNENKFLYMDGLKDWRKI